MINWSAVFESCLFETEENREGPLNDVVLVIGWLVYIASIIRILSWSRINYSSRHSTAKPIVVVDQCYKDQIVQIGPKQSAQQIGNDGSKNKFCCMPIISQHSIMLLSITRKHASYHDDEYRIYYT